jgi:glycosyltransferase involved in cell wall biosynthesis
LTEADNPAYRAPALLVPPDDSEQLAAAIEELRESPERAADLGAAAWHAVQELTWTARARAILGAFL